MPQKVWQKNRFEKIAITMEKNSTIQELLGISQENMAMILQITRTQWSMYVLGKRSLPVAATLKLAEILNFVTKPEIISQKSVNVSVLDESKKEMFFETQKNINKHQQIITKNKLNAIQKKNNTAFSTLKIISFLETKESTQENQNVYNSIKQNAETNIKKNNLLVQTKLQIKLELLQHEEKIIFQKMNKCS